MWYWSWGEKRRGEKKKNIVASSHPALAHQMIYYCELRRDIVEALLFPRRIKQVA